MYNIYSLKNGLKVVTEKIEYVNSISVGIWMKIGARNEKKEQTGISHFIEHMLFKGTKNKSAMDIVKSIEDVGGHINAFTGKETTCIYVRALNTHEKLCVETLADMIFNSLFNEEDIEKEKMVIGEEINMNDDSPEDLLTDLQCLAMWGDGALSNTILGTKEAIGKFNRDKLKKYIKENYIPQNCVISICGNFSEDMTKLVEENFSNWENKNSLIRTYDVPVKVNNNIFKPKEIEQLHINMGLEGVELGSDDMYPLAILTNRFGGGASSILFQKVREEQGLCYSVYAFNSAYVNTGALNIYGALSPNTVQQFIDITREEVEKFSKFKFSNDDLYKAKEQLKGGYLLALENTSNRMFSNGRTLLMSDRVKTPDEILGKIEAIDNDKIEVMMERIFKKGILNYTFVGSGQDNVSLENLNVLK